MPLPSPSASRSSINRLLVGLVLGALGAAVVGRRRHLRAEARLLREAKEREAEGALLAAQLVTAEQDERRRLSIFLHDGPLQSLSGIALMHDAALRALEEGRLDDAARVIQGALDRERELIQTLRDLSFAIEPVILRDHGFGAAVQALADQIEQARSIDVRVEAEAGEALGEKAQVALYQTIREAVGQAVRRNPKHLSIAVRKAADGGFVARVADDGLGERRRTNVEAIGERARILQGKVSVEPGKEGGTVVLVTLAPYVAAAA